eukprot:4019249-Ditylum_brightwellii.AAC.1
MDNQERRTTSFMSHSHDLNHIQQTRSVSFEDDNDSLVILNQKKRKGKRSKRSRTKDEYPKMVMNTPSLSATSAKSERSKSKKHAKKNISVEGILKKEKCEASISSVENSVTFAIEVDRNSIHVPMFIGLEVEEEQA